jgi:hypothetical protein
LRQRTESDPAQLGAAGRKPRIALRVGAEGPPPVDDRDALPLGVDHQPFDHAASGEGDEVARIEREHLIVAAEARTLAEATPSFGTQARHWSSKRYLHADHPGSIVAVTNSSGAPSINKYDDYGIPPIDVNNVDTNTGRFQYTGQAFIVLGIYGSRGEATKALEQLAYHPEPRS